MDMAGFAINLNLILSTNASFNSKCTKSAPETCFLSQFGMEKEEVTPFGWNENPKEILVWHTKTGQSGTGGEHHNYTLEV